MPSDVGRSRGGAFKYLKDRIWSRIQGWLEILLSSGGKDVLIKSVAEAIPIFSMACFKLHRGLFLHINSMPRKFWWGSHEGKRKTCWVAWREMCKPKLLGGLGFRDIELFNLSLLARQGWRMLQNPESLSARVLKEVYFPETDLLHAMVGSAPSQVWRAVHEGIQVLKQGLIRRIGTGENTHPWNDQWLPREGTLRPIACIANEPPSRVADFIMAESASWNEVKLRHYMLPMDVETVLQIPLSHRRQNDLWAWHYDRKGIFSVRSAYRMLIYTRENREAWLQGYCIRLK
jgi:hypothetical protein